jgi:hypothetical protein
MGIIWDYYEDMTSMTSNMEISWNILEVIWCYWWCFLGTVLCIGVIDPWDIDQCGGFRFVDDWGYPSPGETKPTNRTRRASPWKNGGHIDTFGKNIGKQVGNY